VGDLLSIGEFARDIDIVAQPIVDLVRGTVVGYEALARFPTTNGLGVEGWFELADRSGLGHRLEAAALANALDLRGDLPPNCFLTVNVGPTALTTRAVRDVLAQAGSLAGVVVELTEHRQVEDLPTVLAVLDELRRAGAMVAIDDAGAGYAGLRHILDIRPDLLKIDRSLISELDTDETKRALVSMLGVFADRADAWLLAEGIETPGELAAAVDLGVPLGQGWALARPAPPWATLDDAVADTIRTGLERSRQGNDRMTAATVMEVARWADADTYVPATTSADPRPLVLLDPRRRPVAVLATPSAAPSHLGITRAHPDTELTNLARRMLARPHQLRHTPVAIVDGAGRYLGIVRWERTIEALIERADTPAVPGCSRAPTVPA